MTKSFAVAMLIVGTTIGAGFASGAELIAFFGNSAGPLTAIFCAVLIFCVSAVFLWIGSKLNAKNVSEVNLKLAGKFHFFTDAFLLVNNLIVLAGMLAGMDSLFGSILIPLSPLYAVLSGALCVAVVCRGIGGVIKVNKITAPITVLAIATIAVMTIVAAGNAGKVSLAVPNPMIAIVYICMNLMLASTVLTTLGKLDTKTIFLSSGMAAVFLGGLMGLLFAALNRWGYSYSAMPVLDMAKAIHPFAYWLMVSVLIISIFTTMMTAAAGLAAWFHSFFGSRVFTSVVVVLAGLTLSNLGFSTVVKFLYPVIGVSGVIYTVLAVVFVIRSKLKKSFTPKNRRGHTLVRPAPVKKSKALDKQPAARLE